MNHTSKIWWKTAQNRCFSVHMVFLIHFWHGFFKNRSKMTSKFTFCRQEISKCTEKNSLDYTKRGRTPRKMHPKNHKFFMFFSKTCHDDDMKDDIIASSNMIFFSAVVYIWCFKPLLHMYCSRTDQEMMHHSIKMTSRRWKVLKVSWKN